MIYLSVEWIHTFPDEPIRLYHEIDDERWERRKVEVFQDGTLHYADAQHTSGSTELSIEPLPSNEEIVSDPAFKLRDISSDEFAHVWDLATKNVVN
jgi:hypothetical protein